MRKEVVGSIPGLVAFLVFLVCFQVFYLCLSGFSTVQKHACEARWDF